MALLKNGALLRQRIGPEPGAKGVGAHSIKPPASASKIVPVALAETNEKQEHHDGMQEHTSANAAATGKKTNEEPMPEVLKYPSYVAVAGSVADAVSDINERIYRGLNEAAHAATMKSLKYKYGLEGLRGNFAILRDSVGQYKAKIRGRFRTQADSMHEALEAGMVWQPKDFSKKFPENSLWQEPMKAALSEEPLDDFRARSKYRRYALAANVGQAEANEFVHPEASNVYKMGYSHGYKNASDGREHGVESQMSHDPQPMAYQWTPEGAAWASKYFTGTNEMKAPRKGGWLTTEQQELLQKKDPDFDPNESGIRKGHLRKELDDNVLPYTWTMNGYLWALENAIFPGPPPSVHSWVTQQQMKMVEENGRNADVHPEGRDMDELCNSMTQTLHFFNRHETEEGKKGGRPKPWPLSADERERSLKSDSQIMPEGWQIYAPDLSKVKGEQKWEPKDKRPSAPTLQAPF